MTNFKFSLLACSIAFALNASTAYAAQPTNQQTNKQPNQQTNQPTKIVMFLNN